MRRFPDVETVKDSIIVEMMLHCILQWLGGGSYLYIRLSAGIGKPAIYSCIYKCINNFGLCRFGTDVSRHCKLLDEAAQGFESLSSQSAIEGCVACFNGFLLQIIVPSCSETGNVKAYFQGIIRHRE